MSAPLLTAARASLANLFAEGPHPDLSTPNGSVLYRAFQLCQKALKRQYAIWGGVAWLCNALAVDSAGLELSGVAKPSADQLGPVSIHPRDRGFIKRARLDDDARSKIFRHTASAEADEALQAIMTDSVGFSISGIESQGDGAPGLLELYQPGAAAAGDTVSWLTNDYHFELDDPGVQVRRFDKTRTEMVLRLLLFRPLKTSWTRTSATSSRATTPWIVRMLGLFPSCPASIMR